jgi:predicted ArsR family transcriptional regulator
MTADEFSAAVTAVTSAFGDPTRRDIYLFAREASIDGGDGVTAAEVAEQFDLHPNVARHHLEKLTSGGYLSVAVARGSSPARSAGRPSKRYRTSDVEAELGFRPRRDDILANLLARALDLLGPEQAAAMADEVGFEYGRSLAQQMGPGESHRSVRTALAVVADALTAHGFAAHAEAKGDKLAIISECCPFGEAANQYPHVVCAVDRGMIRGLLAGLYGDTAPEFEASRPDGDERCITRV